VATLGAFKVTVTIDVLAVFFWQKTSTCAVLLGALSHIFGCNKVAVEKQIVYFGKVFKNLGLILPDSLPPMYTPSDFRNLRLNSKILAAFR